VPPVVRAGRPRHGGDLRRVDAAEYVAKAVNVTPDRPILIDKFLENAIECEADAIADGSETFVPTVMEHIELAGIHSGDSACVIRRSPSRPSTWARSTTTPPDRQ